MLFSHVLTVENKTRKEADGERGGAEGSGGGGLGGPGGLEQRQELSS